MGEKRPLKLYRSPQPRPMLPPPHGTMRRGPRHYLEWKTLRRWGRLPTWEQDPVGYLLRDLREEAGLTQVQMGECLGCSQQAIAQAERWDSNPTVALLRRWAAACDAVLELNLVRR